MPTTERRAIAPNPYSRQPIRKPAGLADRRLETERIDYYLGLTAARQSPHIALIGERGVGKTSLLNAAQALAQEKRLLPIRIDLNEKKASSPGRFWYDFYSTLLLAAGAAGCWGGTSGEIYRSLFAMIHMGQPASIDMTVLQFPQVFANQLNDLDAVTCVDALIDADLHTVLAEADGIGLRGLAVLIDEADCIGTNIALLQMFRNIFQRIDSIALVLAGTEAIFPKISDVFSPIPRQFHRIDVEAFGDWSDTLNLICAPLNDPATHPSVATARELHELCGGDPAELQLYCHHMYRELETGSTARMSLQPRVFRRVMREYQATARTTNDDVFAAIEGLPASLLFESRWLRRHRISREQNVSVERLRAELRAGRPLREGETSEIDARVRDSYTALHEAGVIASPERLELVGGPVASGYWKSYVEVERSKRWYWNRLSYADLVTNSIVLALGDRTDAVAIRAMPTVEGTDATAALGKLRRGEQIDRVAAGDVFAMSQVTIKGRDGEAEEAIDVGIVVGASGSSTPLRVSYLAVEGQADIRTAVETWIETQRELLERYHTTVEVKTMCRWALPSSDEMQWLAFASDAPDLTLREEYFGLPMVNRALREFDEGNIAGAAALFRQMLWHQEKGVMRNNLAYCLLVLGQHGEAGQVLAEIEARDETYMTRHNAAIQQVLSGEVDAGANRLEALWNEVREERSQERLDAYCMLTLNWGLGTVASRAELPTDAAVLINLVVLRRMERETAVTEIKGRYPNEYAAWVRCLTEDHPSNLDEANADVKG